MTRPQVAIVMGSDSDLPVMQEAANILDEFGVPYELCIASAHRAPDLTEALAKNAHKKGIEVIIAGAGAAAHLAGVIASKTTLPVLGVPIDSSSLKGLDSLLSTVQMPGGIPVATMAIGKAGAKNAALLAIRFLALEDKALNDRLAAYVKKMARDVEKKQRSLKAS